MGRRIAADDEITSSMDYIESSDVDARIDHLESEQLDLELEVEDLKERIEEECDNLGIPYESAENWLDQEDLLRCELSDQDWLSLWRLKFLLEDTESKEKELQEWMEEYLCELNSLSALRDSCQYGWGDITLIREGMFQNHALEVAYDMTSRDTLDSWPCYHIDWDEAAEALKIDYTQVDFMGETYLFR